MNLAGLPFKQKLLESCMILTRKLVLLSFITMVLSLRPILRRLHRWKHCPLTGRPNNNLHRLQAHHIKPDFIKESNEKYFEFSRVEQNIYGWWESSGMFKPEYRKRVAGSTKKPFVLPMPPPNVTGYLHMGHAIFVALQDIMARFHRMRGRETLWLPGT